MKFKSYKKILLILLVTIFFTSILLLCFILFTGSSITFGHYIQADNGEHLIADKTAPTVMHSKHDFMFRGLTSGDKILLVHGPTEASYPGSTGAYFCIKLSNGEITDVTSKILLELYDLGWVGKDKSNFPYEFKKASYQERLASMSLTLLDTWDYEYITANSIEEPYGIVFWPKDASEGHIELLCYPGGYQTKCGNDLQTTETELNGFEAVISYYDPTEAWSKGYYSKLETWSDIHFTGLYNSYTFHNIDTESWTQQQLDELTYILNKVDFPYVIMQ